MIFMANLYFGKHRPKTCKTFDKEGWVLQCGSLSKSLAPGYRIGWIIPGRFKEKVISLKTDLHSDGNEHYTIGYGTFSEYRTDMNTI